MKSAFLFFTLCLTCLTGFAASPVKSAPPAKSPEAVTKDLFEYLLAGKKDIAADKEAQARWLTKSLRQTLAEATASAAKNAKKNPTDKGEAPDNATLIGAWEAPTKYSVKTSLNSPYVALVALKYEWGAKTNYAGDTRTMTVVLTLEDNAWRVSDIHTHAGKFCENGSLVEELKRM